MAMVMTAKERLMRLLFREGRKHRDIKFTRGNDSNVSHESFCDSAAAALLRHEAGVLHVMNELPRSTTKTNIDKLIEALK